MSRGRKAAGLMRRPGYRPSPGTHRSGWAQGVPAHESVTADHRMRLPSYRTSTVRFFIMGMTQRGTSLTIVIAMALLASIAAYAILIVATGAARRGGAFQRHAVARYSAEAGIVWAMQRLELQPTMSFAAGNTDLTVNGAAIDVIVPACANTPCETRQIQARVHF